MITEKGVYRTLTVQKTCQLVSDGYNEAAFQLYSAIPKSEIEKQQNKDGSFLLKAMVINGQVRMLQLCGVQSRYIIINKLYYFNVFYQIVTANYIFYRYD